MKKVLLVAIICSFALGNFSAISQAAPPENSTTEAQDSLLDDVNWYWLNSDAKYSNFFDPESLQINSRIITDTGSVPTEIQGWIKTTYSYEGAKETIKSYGIENVIPDPSKLSYSLALLKIDPQNRIVRYAREDFYDAEGKVIWSKDPRTAKDIEINSQKFEEIFYDAIVDEVFRQGESDRRTAPEEEHWLILWTVNDENGVTTASADTTTFRLRNNNLIFWEWIETKNSDDKTIEIFFLKKMVNLPQGTEKTAAGDKWTPHTGWTKYNDEMNGGYRMIQSDEPAYKGLIRLRAYAKQNPDWINRYSVD